MVDGVAQSRRCEPAWASAETQGRPLAQRDKKDGPETISGSTNSKPWRQATEKAVEGHSSTQTSVGCSLS